MLNNKRQKALIIMCFLLYVFSYIGRYSYNTNIVVLIEDYNITKSEAGLVATFYFIAYGIGQFVNGMLCKKYNKKYVLTIALVVSALLNLIAFFKPPFALFKYMWFINGAMLATLWPSIICLLGDYLDDKYLDRSIVIMNSTTAVGTVIIYGLSSLCNQINFYNLTFLISFVMCLGLAISWFIFCKNDIGKVVNKEINNSNREKTIKKSTFTILYLIIILAILSVIVNLFKDGLTTWVPNILKETFNYPESLSIILTMVLPILGIFGSTLAVYVNKKVKNYLLSLTLLFAATLLFTISIILSIKYKMDILLITSFGFVALFTHSMNGLITGIVPLEERNNYPSGKMAGILNATSYIGSAISSYGLGLLADNYDWSIIFYLFLVLIITCTMISLVSGIILLKRNKEAIQNT